MCEDFPGYDCVPSRLCSGGEIITDGEGQFVIRQGLPELDPTKSKCGRSFDVCCKHEVSSNIRNADLQR